MELKKLITDDMKTYMKEKTTDALDAVRMLKAEIKNQEIELKRELNDSEVVKIIQSTVKKNKEAAEIYLKAGRDDLMKKEEAYTEALKKYLPEQLSKQELKDIVNSLLDELGIKDINGFGQAVKATMAKVAGRTDGKTVSDVVKESLHERF